MTEIGSLAFSADGKRVFIGWVSENPPRTWDAETGAELHALDHGKAQIEWAAFSPDGTQLVTGAHDKKARVWDAGTGKLVRTLDHEGTVLQVEFSSDGKSILTCAESKSLQVWDAATGQPVAQFRDPTGMVRGAFSPDGREVFVSYIRPGGPASGKCSARLWPLAPLPEAVRRKPRELTPAEREANGVPANE